MLLAVLLVGFTSGATALMAQTSTNAPGTPSAPAARPNRMISFLPKADQDRVMSAHSKALADNPALKTEEDELKQDRPDMQTSSPEDLMAYMEKARSHQQKLREAMLKEDSTLGPVLDKIDQHMSEMRAKQVKASTNAAPAATNAPPASAGSTNAPAAH